MIVIVVAHIPSFMEIFILCYIGHSGVCPVVRRPATCSPTITYSCESDIDCKQHEKCCFDGCGKACVSKNLGMLDTSDYFMDFEL